MAWKRCPLYQPFSLEFPQKRAQKCGTLVFYLLLAWIDVQVVGNLRHDYYYIAANIVDSYGKTSQSG